MDDWPPTLPLLLLLVGWGELDGTGWLMAAATRAYDGATVSNVAAGAAAMCWLNCCRIGWRAAARSIAGPP